MCTSVFARRASRTSCSNVVSPKSRQKGVVETLDVNCADGTTGAESVGRLATAEYVGASFTDDGWYAGVLAHAERNARNAAERVR